MMPTIALSPKASIAAGALFAYIRPRLAQDAKIPDMKSALLPMKGGKSFHDSKAAIANAVRSIVKGRLAQDADIDDVAQLLDAIENVVESPEESVPMGLGEENGEQEIHEEAPPVDPAVTDPNADPDEAKDDGPAELMAKIREFLKDHVSEEVLAQFDQLVGSGQEPEEVPPAADPDPKLEDDDDMSKDKEPMTKAAMDAAITAAVLLSEKNGRETRRAIRAAEDAVRPIVGDLAIAYDSADEVYKAALASLGVKDLDTIHPSAYRHILADRRERRATAQSHTPMAADALPTGVKTFAERFPATAKIVNM